MRLSRLQAQSAPPEVEYFYKGKVCSPKVSNFWRSLVVGEKTEGFSAEG
jgi:hypothetical protein